MDLVPPLPPRGLAGQIRDGSGVLRLRMTRRGLRGSPLPRTGGAGHMDRVSMTAGAWPHSRSWVPRSNPWKCSTKDREDGLRAGDRPLDYDDSGGNNGEFTSRRRAMLRAHDRSMSK